MSKPLKHRTWAEIMSKDSWSIFKIMAELVEGYDRMQKIGPCVSIFGSARTKPGEEYYESGQLKSKFNLADGKLHGPHETYYENGQLKYKWNYEDGKMHGLQKDYEEDGSLSFSIKYENGVYVPD